jgi:hypothetical protein
MRVAGIPKAIQDLRPSLSSAASGRHTDRNCAWPQGYPRRRPRTDLPCARWPPGYRLGYPVGHTPARAEAADPATHHAHAAARCCVRCRWCRPSPSGVLPLNSINGALMLLFRHRWSIDVVTRGAGRLTAGLLGRMWQLGPATSAIEKLGAARGARPGRSGRGWRRWRRWQAARLVGDSLGTLEPSGGSIEDEDEQAPG